MNTAQPLWYVFLVMLFILSFILAFRKKYTLSAIVGVLAFIAFIGSQLASQKEDYKTGNSVTFEQCVCWVFAVAFFVLACFFLQEKNLPYAFVIFLICVATFFCGLSGVQAVIKTHLLGQLTASLESYGEKIDGFQSNVAKMNEEILKQEEINKSNSLNLSKVQKEITKAQLELRAQQETNSFQFGQLTALSAKIQSASSNLSVQQAQLNDVKSLIKGLFSNTEHETVSGNDTNHFFLFDWGNSKLICCFLSHSVIQNSVHGILLGDGEIAQTSLAPITFSHKNCISFILQGPDITKRSFSFDYVKDETETNLIHSIKGLTGNTLTLEDNFFFQILN